MTLLFVYNANSGTLNALFDAGHKLFSPKTYQCNLCALTFDTFTENTIWKSFRNENSVAMEFYHKDEFEAKFPNDTISYPAILKLEKDQLTTIFDDKALSEISSVDELISQLKTTL